MTIPAYVPPSQWVADRASFVSGSIRDGGDGIVVEAVQLACATSGRHQGVAAIDVPQVDVSPRGDEGFPD